MSRMSRRIVVDASCARAAGEGIHPVSKMCRQFMLDMLTICHKVVTSPAIKAEWDKHASSFSVEWLAAMRSKGKLVPVSPEHDANGLLADKVFKIEEFTVKQLVAIEKDLLLVLAALETDRLIASNDQVMRGLLARAAGHITDISGIVWVNPSTEEDDCPTWLKSGARHSAERTLGEYQASAGGT